MAQVVSLLGDGSTRNESNASLLDRNDKPVDSGQIEVGPVPKDWHVVALGKVGSASAGLTYSPKQVCSSGLLVLRSSNIQRDQLALDDCVYVNAKIPDELYVQKNDILICVRNGSRALIGKCLLLPSFEAPTTFGAFMMVYRSEHARWVFYQLRSRVLKQQIDAHLGATINQITSKSLKGFLVPLPTDPDEEDAVVDALSKADTLIAALERLLAKKRDLRQATLQALLSGRIRLPGFSGEWKERRLGDIAQAHSGGTPPSGVAAFYGGDIPWVSITDITQTGKYLSGTARNLSSLGLMNSSAQIFPSGTVLYAMYASIGKCCLTTLPVSTSQAILGIRPSKEVDRDFLYYKLLSMQKEVEKMGQHGTQANLSAQIVRDFILMLPDVDEQREIAQVLIRIDEEAAQLDQRLSKTLDLKQGMMQELLTGRIRLA